MICTFCGAKHEVIAAPFIDNPNKWAIYRANYVEIVIYIGDNVILNQSKQLTRTEVDYIVKYILGK